MNAAKITGGLLALIGGAFILIQALLFADVAFMSSEYTIAWLINIALLSLAISGGILGIVGKKAGGILALISGVLAICLGIITVYVTYTEMMRPFSFFTSTLDWFSPPDHIFAGISIEALLILVGGIVIIATGSDQK